MATTTLQQLPSKANIKLYKGDDWPIQLRRYVDEARTTLADFTGYTAELRIADSTGTILNTLSTSTGEIVLLDGSGTYNIGIQFLRTLVDSFTWTSADYDFSMTDTNSMTRTLFKGKISIISDV